jgi:hypothetical protein
MNQGKSRVDLLILFVILINPGYSIATERITTAGARDAALSQSVVALPGAFSVFQNQALLAEDKSVSVGISHRQPYFIPGYHESALSVVVPVQGAVLAVGITQSSLSSYTESGFGISIAKKLSARLSVGLFFNSFLVSLPEAGTHKGSFQLDGGLKYACSEKLNIGFHLSNIVQTRIGTFQYNLSFPLLIRGGASYTLSEAILMTGETLFETGSGFSGRYGTELSLADKFRIRGGISTNPFQHSVGFGYAWNVCNIDFAMVHHELLGYSPLLSLCFQFK